MSQPGAVLLALVVINSGAFPFFINWYCHYRCALETSRHLNQTFSLPITLLVRAADKDAWQRLQYPRWNNALVRVRAERAALQSAIPSYQSMKASNDQFYALEREKFRALLELLDRWLPSEPQIYILLSDTDVVFLHEPIASMLEHGQADLYMQCDGCDVARYGPRHVQCPYQYNTGIMLLALDRRTEAGRLRYRALRQLVAHVVRVSNLTERRRHQQPESIPLHDQIIFNQVLREWVRRDLVQLVAPYQNGSGAEEHIRLRVMYLSYQAFPNGCVLFGYKRRAPDPVAQERLRRRTLAAVHANYRSGAEAKRNALQAAGVWIPQTYQLRSGSRECPPCLSAIHDRGTS
ncbi:hypothetical protein F1559_003381 [Cyanidiococcus yangmingshanensis]|uniref:Nucleotide-diphospho-sugar transferase domain-containing protein n=1 Tax=Cyanidiococcus yangmingshanensis TaxID=2690220 RepID=A0A7J7IHF2_9RHOD|nr:hypothetical protein F1559_003381 [Cyanidiococcus yangmingshanensis]